MNKEKIRLFVDAHCFDNEFQGTRTFIRELYRHLQPFSDRLEYYFGANDIENLRREFDFMPNAHFIRYASGNSISRIYFEIPKILKEKNIDLAHFQYISPFRKHCRYIVTTHDILFNDFKKEFSFLFRFSRNFLFRYSIQHADIKTTVSAYSRERLEYHYRLNKKDIHIIPNGVNASFFEDFQKTDAQDYIRAKHGIENFILYISRIEPRKNNILLLRSWLDLKLYEEGYALVFIGKISIRSKQLDEMLASMPAEAKRLFFHIEQVSDADLLKFYQSAEVFVYPSIAEGFGIPPLEAAALKIPVLCSSRTAMTDYTFFGQHFFDPDNQKELEEKLVKILSGKDNTDYSFISEEIRKNYSWRSSAEKLHSLLKDKYPEL